MKFRLEDQARNGADQLASKLGHANREANALHGALAKIGAIAGGYIGIRGAYDHLVKFNAEVENAKISLTAMVEGGFGGSFAYARAQAEGLYNEFQKFSTKTPMTTQEMLEFSRGVAVSVQQAGGSIQDIVGVTEQGAIAAKALGMESHYAARELSEMLAGNVSARMLFAKQLIGLGGQTIEGFRGLDAGARLAFLKQTLNSPAMKDAVASMSTSFAGVTSTLVDKLQILLGKVGLPLFKAITAEVASINEWLDKNQVAIDKFAHTVAEDLVAGFRMAKNAVGFIVDHKDALIEIGKIWAVGRLTGMLGGGIGLGGGPKFGAIGGAFSAAFAPLGQSLAKSLQAGVLSFGLRFPTLAGGLLKMGGALSGVAGAAGALGPQGILGLGFAAHELGEYLGVHKALTEVIDPQRVKLERLTKSMQILDDSVARAAHELDGIHGAGGTQAAANMQGLSDQLAIQANVLGDIQAGRGAYGNQFVGSTAIKDALEQAGFGPDEVDKMVTDAAARSAMLAQVQAQKSQLDMKAGTSILGADLLLAYGKGQLTEYQRSSLDEQKAQLDVMQEMVRAISEHRPPDIAQILKMLREDSADPDGKKKTLVEKPKVNVTIHRIEIQSDDPDRIAFGLMKSWRDAAKNPSQSNFTYREG